MTRWSQFTVLCFVKLTCQQWYEVVDFHEEGVLQKDGGDVPHSDEDGRHHQRTDPHYLSDDDRCDCGAGQVYGSRDCVQIYNGKHTHARYHTIPYDTKIVFDTRYLCIRLYYAKTPDHTLY